MEKLLEYKIMPRLMMAGDDDYVYTLHRVGAERNLTFINAAELRLLAVVAGAMSGAFAIWLGSEK